MYIYQGFNPDSGDHLKKEFDAEVSAIAFADTNAVDYPMFTVIDTEIDNEVVYADKFTRFTQRISEQLDCRGEYWMPRTFVIINPCSH